LTACLGSYEKALKILSIYEEVKMIVMKFGFACVLAMGIISGCAERLYNHTATPENSQTAENIVFADPINPDGEGLNFVLTGTQWSNINISYSFMPDGTWFLDQSSSLFNLLNPLGVPAVWQREYARALSKWQAVSALNFRFVADNGANAGSAGALQANPNYGDIRFAAKQLSNPNYAGLTYYPSTSTSLGGDMLLNTSQTYHIGANPDLFTVAIHETGHSLGLKDSTVFPSRMYPAIYKVFNQLEQDDINGIQAVYGPRLADAYDATAANDTPQTASVITVAASGQTFINGDLTTMADVDHYRFVVPADAAPVLSVTAEANRSLLQAKLKVFDGSGTLISEASAADYAQGVLLQVAGMNPGAEYIIGVDSPALDEFHIGAYRLAIEFRADDDGIAYVPPTPVTPDAKEVNDSLAFATDLGQTSSKTTTGLNIHWAWDEDFFKFKTVNSTVSNYEVSVAYTSGTAPLEIVIFNAAGTKIAQSNGATYVRFPVVRNTSYSARVYCPTRLLRGYNLTVKKYN
jgi:hypothetical protein